MKKYVSYYRVSNKKQKRSSSNTGRLLDGVKTKEKAKNNPNNVRAVSLIFKCRNEVMSFAQIADELNKNKSTTVIGKLFKKATDRRLFINVKS